MGKGQGPAEAAEKGRLESNSWHRCRDAVGFLGDGGCLSGVENRECHAPSYRSEKSIAAKH